MRKAAMLRQLLAAARIGNSDVGRDQNIWRARIVFWRQSGRVENLCDPRTPEDLTDTRDVSSRWRLRFERVHRALRGATVAKPNQRNVILGRPDAIGVGRRFRKWQ